MVSTDSNTHHPPAAVLQRISAGRYPTPLELLGPHAEGNDVRIIAFAPQAERVFLGATGTEFEPLAEAGFFQCLLGPGADLDPHYRLDWLDRQGNRHSALDPYSFPTQISDEELQWFSAGRHWRIHHTLGAHPREVDGIRGVRFATWAPHAERVSVVGDFNDWDGRRHPMQAHIDSGVWELFIPAIDTGALYKFELRNLVSGTIHMKTDPYGRQFELRPQTASIVAHAGSYPWRDADWMRARQQADWLHRPLSVYEVHLGSWQRNADHTFSNYRQLAARLVEYVQPLGFTHIELMPITEHPLDASWGYQASGYFAPTSRFGTPDDFRYFVDYCHRHGLGVILDWVPAHFPKDDYGLARFDGEALYEHADPHRGEHRDWGTLIYNLGRNEVRNFLLASALFWLQEFHLDGLRVDAVASMLYLDYSRQPGDWTPNIHGGNEHLEASAFIRELNRLTHGECPGSLMFAEESTAWPQVTRPTWEGGLGFSLKWNMGWMHDTLGYLRYDPLARRYHHSHLSFALSYAFSENYILPLSHDEVVHGKGSLLNKMPGDDWQRFANLRLLYTFMFTHPGKKLLFMGDEFAQRAEWDYDHALDWYRLEESMHRGIHGLISDLNQAYRDHPALHAYDFEPRGFEWLDCDDAEHSVFSYLRRADEGLIVTVLNCTPIARHTYRLGVPFAGIYREILNSDAGVYGGGDVGNGGSVRSEPTPYMGREHSLTLTLPPLGGLLLKHQPERAAA